MHVGEVRTGLREVRFAVSGDIPPMRFQTALPARESRHSSEAPSVKMFSGGYGLSAGLICFS